jgi:hypothetical protein
MFDALILAQETPQVLGINWGTIIGALGPTGILVWHLWYTTAVTLPRKDAEFRETLDKIVADFRAELKSEREARAAEIKALREGIRCDEA